MTFKKNMLVSSNSLFMVASPFPLNFSLAAFNTLIFSSLYDFSISSVLTMGGIIFANLKLLGVLILNEIPLSLSIFKFIPESSLFNALIMVSFLIKYKSIVLETFAFFLIVVFVPLITVASFALSVLIISSDFSPDVPIIIEKIPSSARPFMISLMSVIILLWTSFNSLYKVP